MILPELIPKEPGIYLVGGTVRDILMGKQPTDYDVAVQSPCEPLAQRIAQNAGSRVIPVGKPNLRVYRVVSGELSFDVAPLEGGSIQKDLKRRDFTVNALAWDLCRNRLIDIFDGRQDIQERRIRMVLPENFLSDPLRLLRAFRFGAALQFLIEPATKTEIRKHTDKIAGVAGERIRDELMKMLACDKCDSYLQEMDSVGLLTKIFPELEPLKSCQQNKHHDFDGFKHTMAAFSCAEKILAGPDALFKEPAELREHIKPEPARLKLCLLLHDIGKPACRTQDEEGNIHFYRHEALGADIARAVSQRLKLSNNHRTYTDFIIRNHLKPLHLFNAHQNQQLTRRAIIRFLIKSHPLTVDLLIHAIADARGKKTFQSPTAFEQFCRQLVHVYAFDFQRKSKSPPLITGHDLINELRLTPSSLFSELLSRVEEERLAGGLQNRAEALEWIKKFIGSNNLS